MPLLLAVFFSFGDSASLVLALGAAMGYEVVRINLSEQTDIMDLIGSDYPIEGGKGGEFGWRDGILLTAIKAGKENQKVKKTQISFFFMFH